MNTLDRLKALLAPSARVQSGSVVGVTALGVLVRTASGVREFSVANPGQFAAGDAVHYQNGVLLGRQPSDASVPEYYV